MSAALTLKDRRHTICEILEARFNVAGFEEIRRTNPGFWESPRNDMGRGIYGEAMREKQRLQRVPDEQLANEAAAIRGARQT